MGAIALERGGLTPHSKGFAATYNEITCIIKEMSNSEY
jgi:hypothetical protein